MPYAGRVAQQEAHPGGGVGHHAHGTHPPSSACLHMRYWEGTYKTLQSRYSGLWR